VISAWDIYWVMQLDSINDTLGLFAFFAIVGGLLASVARVVAKADADTDPSAAAFVRATRVAPWVLSAGLLAWAISTALPSTKTAAAMVVIPAVANNQAIQHEAADLYGIAKDALRELAKPKETAK